MKPIKKAVATVGKYTDNQGNEKNRYVTVGKVFERTDGSRCHKIDSLPVGNEWSGWINEYPMDENRQQAPAHAPVATDSDVPF